MKLDTTRPSAGCILVTSEVYGDPAVHPQTEDYWGNVNPIGVSSCYDEGKRCAETLFFDYRRKHNVPIRVARIFNTYGPHYQHDPVQTIKTSVLGAINLLGLAKRLKCPILQASGEAGQARLYISSTST